MEKPNKISLVIISKNEEKNIQRCLESVKGIVDEIIVIDSLSTDKTKEICEQYDVRFVQQEWLGYSATKNLGNRLASHDWILSLDADEAISGELKKNIIKEKENFRYDAYISRRMTNYCGKWIRHCGWYPDPKMRLWKKTMGEWNGDIHETVDLQKNARIGKLSGDILHYSISTVFQHIEQINKFSEIYSQSAFQKGKASNMASLLFKPVERFFTTYIFKLGILDGYYGFLISALSAHSIFLRRVKLRQLWKDFEHKERFE
ncbi:MAG: glycosyltransferase family 2 protein [Bacteroidales bacterium]|nr:glycosyltransferase family 2 protein [Bacteroidales bacterium]MCF8455136.1 glycosyltransferase family 2 protein [Bacteroidales bacterium]